MSNDMDLCHFQEICLTNMELLDTAGKTGLDALKTASKKVVRKAAEATVKLIESKITGKIMKPKPLPAEYSRKVEDKIIPLERRKNTKQIKKSVIKMEHHKISKILNDSTVSKFATRKWIEVKYLSGSQYFVNKNINLKTHVVKIRFA